MIPQTASGTTRDKEHKSFVDSPTRGSDYTAREVYVGNNEESPVITTNAINWDSIEVSFPSLNQDLFSYKKDSITKMTVLVTYSSNNKKQIINIVKEFF